MDIRWWRRCAGWGLLGLGSLAAICHLVVRYPATLFRYSVREQGLTLRSDQPFDGSAGRAILAGVRARLDRVATGFEGSACITQTPWRRRLFFLPEPRAIGISMPFVSTIFIREAHVDRNRVVNSLGREVGLHLTLQHVIGHEFGHVITYRKVGYLRTLHQVPEWIREGIAEYVGGIDGFDFQQDCQAFLKNETIMGPPVPGVPPYRRLHLLVFFLIERRGWNLERLLRELPSQTAVEGWLRDECRTHFHSS